MRNKRKNIKIFIFFIIINILFTFYSFSNDKKNDDKIEQKIQLAETHYDNQEFEKALILYLEIEKQKDSDYKLFFNIGNCYLNLDEIGKAILYYRKALLYSPNNEKIKNNLKIARQKVQLDVPYIEVSKLFKAILFFYYYVSLNNMMIFAGIGFILFFVSFSLYFFTMRKKRIFIILILCGFFLFSLFSITFYIKYHNTYIQKYAVILKDNITVRTGPNESFEKAFELVEGIEMDVRNIRESVSGEKWYKIILTDGKHGWIKAEDAEIVNPS